MKHIFGLTNEPSQPIINQQIIEAATAVAKNLGAATTINSSEYFPGWNAFAYMDDKIHIEYSPSQGYGRGHHDESVEIWQTTIKTSRGKSYCENIGEHVFYYREGNHFPTAMPPAPHAGDAWVHHLLHVVYAGYKKGQPYKSPELSRLKAEEKAKIEAAEEATIEAKKSHQQELATFRAQYPPELQKNIGSILSTLGKRDWHFTFTDYTYEDSKIFVRRHTEKHNAYSTTDNEYYSTWVSIAIKSSKDIVEVFHETDEAINTEALVFRPGKWIEYVNTTLIDEVNRAKASKKAAAERAERIKQQMQESHNATRNAPIDDSDIFP